MEIIRFGHPFIIDDLKITLLPANHILGSAQILVENEDDHKQILYTGDFNPNPSYIYPKLSIHNLEEKYEIKISPDAIIVECSNIDFTEKNYALEEIEFIEKVNNTYKNLGNILIPAKALGDAQEIILKIFCLSLNNNLNMPSCIFTLGSLEKVNEIYHKYRDDFNNPDIIELINNNLFVKDLYEYIKNNFDRDDNLFFENRRDYGIKIFITTGGTIEIGSSRRIFDYIKKGKNNLIVLPYYSKVPNCNAKIIKTHLFSLHGYLESVLNYIQEIKSVKETIVFISHGSKRNLFLLNEKLKSLKIQSLILNTNKENYI